MEKLPIYYYVLLRFIDKHAEHWAKNDILYSGSCNYNFQTANANQEVWFLNNSFKPNNLLYFYLGSPMFCSSTPVIYMTYRN